MKDWVPMIIGGAFLGLMASSAVGSIKDDVALGCVESNTKAGRRGATTTRFCMCAAEITAAEASFLGKLLHKARIERITTPHDFGPDFAKRVDAFCNNL